MKDLKGKNIIVTGAGSGIGRLMSLMFADRGANLALVDINKEAVSAVENEVAEKNTRVSSYQCDISIPEQVSQTVASVMSDFKQVDVLVNNAGTVTGKSFMDLTLEEMKRTMDINYWGHVHFIKMILPEMIKKGAGNIVNIASSSGLLGMPILSDYCASKFAEVGLSESLRRELKKYGHKKIKITCVCPYIIDTGMFSGFRAFKLSPFIKPEKAARSIIKAVLRDKPYVMLPPLTMYSMLILKFLPTALFDRLLVLFGAERAMDGFTGRS